MKLEWSDHVEEKIKNRKLSKKKIELTVINPEFTRVSYGLREERYRNFGKNFLKVVVKDERDIVVIITAHWIAKIKVAKFID